MVVEEVKVEVDEGESTGNATDSEAGWKLPLASAESGAIPQNHERMVR